MFVHFLPLPDQGIPIDQFTANNRQVSVAICVCAACLFVLEFVFLFLTSLINKQWEVIALEQLTSHIDQAHQQPRPEFAYDITPPGMR